MDRRAAVAPALDTHGARRALRRLGVLRACTIAGRGRRGGVNDRLAWVEHLF